MLSGPRSLLFSPATSQTVVVPAYLRASKEAPKLPLPPSHELLCKFFDELETMLRYLRARSQPCILSKFKQRVESSVRRSFEISHLEQIVNVFPEAFVFKALNPSESWERKLNLIIEISEDEVPQTFLEIGQASARRLAIFRQRLHSHALPYMKVSTQRFSRPLM